MYNLKDPNTRNYLCSMLYTAVVGDILDSFGLYFQFLPPELRPIHPSHKVFGLAMPVLMMDVYGVQKEPFGKLTHALDDLADGEVYIASGALPRSANWGELLTATAKVRGAVGAVVDGFHRDTTQVLAQSFPVFSRGAWAQDSGPRMAVADFRIPIEIGKTIVRPGDLVFGDIDGVLIVPSESLDEVLDKATEKAKAEKVVRQAIENGMSATQAFKKYGVL